MSNPIGAIELDHSELTVRLLEVGVGLVRPSGQSAQSVLAAVRANAAGKPVNEKALADFEKMASISIEFFAECAAAMQPVN